MQILYLTIGIICLVMIFYGAKWLLRTKTICSFRVSEGIKEFDVKRRGEHALCINKNLGNSIIHNLTISRDSLSNHIEIKENLLKWRFRKKGLMYVEHSLFNVNKEGTYKLSISNLKGNDLVIIKETVPTFKKLLGILFLVFGVNGLFWGIMLSIAPNVLVQ